MKQKKIAFVISSDEIGNWSGGISYFRNLFEIIKDQKKIKIVVYTNSVTFLKKQKLGNFFEIKEIRFLKKNTLSYFFRKIIVFTLNKDLFLYYTLLKDNVTTLSHRKLFRNKKIKSIGWIPDLQHKVLKRFFKNKTYLDRERYVVNELKNSDKIFVSSFQIKKEFKKFYKIDHKIIPLRILSKKQSLIKNTSKRYILFPAQFWEHKNHEFLLKAAKIIKAKNINIKLYFCGKTNNYKNHSHFELINKKINNFKLDNVIKNFGEVSLYQLNIFQKECLAFVNPSLYEGWSTINEEARSNFKYIFLSDIKGHKEQNNSVSIYFNLNSPDDFVRKIQKFLNEKKYLERKKLLIYYKTFNSKINNEVKNILSKEYI